MNRRAIAIARDAGSVGRSRAHPGSQSALVWDERGVTSRAGPRSLPFLVVRQLVELGVELIRPPGRTRSKEENRVSGKLTLRCSRDGTLCRLSRDVPFRGV